MRVLMTTDTIGGVWTFTKELSRELLARGCSVALVSIGPPPSAAQRLSVEDQAALSGRHFRYHHLNAPLEWMNGNEHALGVPAPQLLRIGLEFSADLLLSSQFCFGSLNLDVPRIIVAHSDVLSWAQACRPNGLEHSQWLTNYRSLVANGLRCASAVVAPTRWMLQALAQNWSLPPESHVIPNGRSVDPLDTGRNRRMQAVTAGRLWDEAKNIRILENLSSPIPLFIAGQSNHESESCTIPANKLALLGSLDEVGLLKKFSESALYVCTSIYEPFGLAPLEAALCGCGVVANDIPSLREVWGDNALYFSDAESLRNLLDHLCKDSNLLASLRQRSRARASTFTAARMADSYMALLQSVQRDSMVSSHVA